jgi:hypothetical protein
MEQHHEPSAWLRGAIEHARKSAAMQLAMLPPDRWPSMVAILLQPGEYVCDRCKRDMGDDPAEGLTVREYRSHAHKPDSGEVIQVMLVIGLCPTCEAIEQVA